MKNWYVLHTQSGAEEKVKLRLENKIASSGLKDLVGKIIIPTEQVTEVKRGKRKISERKFFPSYILVEMEMNERSWYLVRTTPGVTGFIGLGRRPSPLPEKDVENILRKAKETKAKPAPKVSFEIEQQVRVVDGPFTNFSGTIDEVNPVKQKLKVSVSIFGRSTPVELEYWQVEKI